MSRRLSAIAGSSSTTSTAGFMARPPAGVPAPRYRVRAGSGCPCAPVLLDDGTRDGHAESGAAVLGGEKEIEGSRLRLFAHAAARVLHRDLDESPVRRTRAQHQGSPRAHGFEGV